MNIILGGTGHIGSAVAGTLLERGKPVTIVARSPAKAEHLRNKGARIAVADVHDVDALRHVFRQGKRLFLLNPPANPSTDTDIEERNTISAILAALDDSGLEKIVAQSAYGVQAGEQIGDLDTLFDLEQGLETKQIPVSIIRAAYYMSNWDASLKTARKGGVIRTLFPADFKIPMVAHNDIGQIAADLLTQTGEHQRLHYVEGPQRYTPADVAAAFAATLGKPVNVVTIPRDKWTEYFEALGFSKAAAKSYSGMTALTVNATFPDLDKVKRGSTSLQDYVLGLIAQDRQVSLRS
ncbi:NmrA family NAD(P)-binding protein [Phyllobacterium myrsinacearum]|uniref:Uncharacterized protein YbjT (DUF2867 family) n=1 Tax=Phyllobacterium myrsinacearum TaxID=28101 RepID=A0A839ESB7_9HYPH|nr:NmrA family NAD(P)-binding protein [Phyllobacterium myrsinacearum]MBA8881819.1 uncharacterized protein YbjT (DUF2867 family) [Phyllobacterium myrsinacearum]